jgi:hypothetical protein
MRNIHIYLTAKTKQNNIIKLFINDIIIRRKNLNVGSWTWFAFYQNPTMNLATDISRYPGICTYNTYEFAISKSTPHGQTDFCYGDYPFKIFFLHCNGLQKKLVDYIEDMMRLQKKMNIF